MIFPKFFVSITATGLLFNAGISHAHGIVKDFKIGETWIKGFMPHSEPLRNPVPKPATWPFWGVRNGPIEIVSFKDITSNRITGKGELTADAKAGDKITFYWTEWPKSHRGPTMTYLANCGSKPCSEVSDPSSLSYFKIDEAGWLGDKWAFEKLIENNNTWTVTIPHNIASGYYLLRHELLALHSARNLDKAQFYPSCTNLKISGSGKARPKGVKFPGAYKNTDPGIQYNLWSRDYNSEKYFIPCPPVYKPGSDETANLANKDDSDDNNNNNNGSLKEKDETSSSKVITSATASPNSNSKWADTLENMSEDETLKTTKASDNQTLHAVSYDVETHYDSKENVVYDKSTKYFTKNQYKTIYV